jgi:predicted dehydrogenase
MCLIIRITSQFSIKYDSKIAVVCLFTMTTIRVALIGLSWTAKTSWAAQGHLPYLLSAKGRLSHEVVALLNSSVTAAEAARDYFDLPVSVKAYGDPHALAQDDSVDLVVCNTRVDVHFSSMEPSVKAGKAVYVEWPLTENLQRAIELTGDQPLPNSIMDLQGHVAPVNLTLKALLCSDRIGRMLTSDVRAFGNLASTSAVSATLEYFSQREVGGNAITIAYAHMIDFVHEVLGEFETFQSRMQIQRPTLEVHG